MMENIPVIIFCGGKGTRMGGSTLTKKELVPVGGYPIIWHVMRIFSAYSFNQFILPLGYEAQQIKRYFLEYERMEHDLTIHFNGEKPQVIQHGDLAHAPWQVSLIDTGIDTPKAGRLAQVADYLQGDRFFVTYGDGISNIDLLALVDFHKQHGKLGTVTAVQVNFQYGVLQADDKGLVTQYAQYPPLPHWINAGFMLFERDALPLLIDTAHHNFDTDIFQPLVPKGELMRFPHQGFWHSMDTLKDRNKLEELWQTEAPWKVWE